MILRTLLLTALALGAAACSNLSLTGSSCDDRRTHAENLVSETASAAENTQCTTDTDCVLGFTSTRCAGGCGSSPVSKSGAIALAAAVSDADTLCGTGCDEPPPPCALGPQFAACMGGTCRTSATAPAAWTSFAIAQGATDGVPLQCPSGASCTLWALTPDAAVTVTKSAVTHQATLTPSDFQTVDGILKSMDFRQHVDGSPFPCNLISAGPPVAINVGYTTVTTGMDVTACINGGPAGNPPQQIFKVMSAY